MYGSATVNVKNNWPARLPESETSTVVLILAESLNKPQAQAFKSLLMKKILVQKHHHS